MRNLTEHNPQPCPLCGTDAVVMLSPKELAESIRSGDMETLAVCHPALGGCNHGFGLSPKTQLLGGGT